MGGRILVVDDVATNRIVLKAKLAIACYDVVQAADGAQALALARTARPDLILLELSLPGPGGHEVLRALKAAPETAEIPVVVVSARAEARTRIAALRAGAEDYLIRPVDDAVLSARVRSLLRSRILAEEFELREGTRAALGFAEPQARVAWQGAGEAAAPARVALVGPDRATTREWRHALAPHLPHHRFDTIDRAQALRLARRAPTDRAGDAVPEIFVLAADLGGSGDGLLLLSDLRAGPATRHAAILLALPSGPSALWPMALDLGACDVLRPDMGPEERALRIAAQLRRARAAEAMRRRLRDGLQLAVTDPLTGLPNRRYALSHMARVARRAARRGYGFAALLLDLDRFKAVNDAHGHAAGDAVLRIVAGRLQGELRAVDLLARIGGEEFLAILPEVGPGEAGSAAERLRASVGAAPVPLPKGGSVRQTISIGLAWGGPADAEGEGEAGDAASLIDRADRALYAAKATGRDRVSAAPSLHRTGSGGFAAA